EAGGERKRERQIEGPGAPLLQSDELRVLLEQGLDEKRMVGVVVGRSRTLSPARIRVDRDAELRAKIPVAISGTGPEEKVGVVVVVVETRIEKAQAELPPAHEELETEHHEEAEGHRGRSRPGNRPGAFSLSTRWILLFPAGAPPSGHCRNCTRTESEGMVV